VSSKAKEIAKNTEAQEFYVEDIVFDDDEMEDKVIVPLLMVEQDDYTDEAICYKGQSVSQCLMEIRTSTDE
jgi:hypothetical protein